MSVYLFAQCHPAEKYWNHDVPGICLSGDTMIGFEYFVSSYSAFLDLLLAVFPAPSIMRLNMPLKTRIAVSSALGLGVFASVIQGYKLSILGAAFEYTAGDPTCKSFPHLRQQALLTPSINRPAAVPQHFRPPRGMHSSDRRLIARTRTPSPPREGAHQPDHEPRGGLGRHGDGRICEQPKQAQPARPHPGGTRTRALAGRGAVDLPRLRRPRRSLPPQGLRQLRADPQRGPGELDGEPPERCA